MKINGENRRGEKPIGTVRTENEKSKESRILNECDGKRKYEKV
jgi:hypothetical protein